MNYIKQLQEENKILKKRAEFFEAQMRQFQGFLNSSKFTGTEQGERKDWISTSDVINWLRDTITQSLVGDLTE